MTLFEIIHKGTETLKASNISFADPFHHMKRIVEYSLEIDSVEFYCNLQKKLSKIEEEKITKTLSQRLSGDPLQYLCGEEWFWKDCFKVGPGCFIPRKETETLIEVALKKIPNTFLKIAELGSGSGNIGLSLVKERSKWQWFGFEKNVETFPYLEQNVKTFGLENYTIIRGDFFKNAISFAPYDVLISNPPYVSSLEKLPIEVQKEPALALYAGEKGLDVIENLIRVAPQILKKKGLFLCEVGVNQKEKIEQILLNAGLQAFEFFNDYSNIARVLCVKV